MPNVQEFGKLVHVLRLCSRHGWIPNYHVKSVHPQHVFICRSTTLDTWTEDQLKVNPTLVCGLDPLADLLHTLILACEHLDNLSITQYSESSLLTVKVAASRS